MAEGSGYPVAVDALSEISQRIVAVFRMRNMQVRILLPQLTLTHRAHGL